MTDLLFQAHWGLHCTCVCGSIWYTVEEQQARGTALWWENSPVLSAHGPKCRSKSGPSRCCSHRSMCSHMRTVKRPPCHYLST